MQRHRDVATKLDLNAGFTARMYAMRQGRRSTGIAAVEQSMKLLGKAMAKSSMRYGP